MSLHITSLHYTSDVIGQMMGGYNSAPECDVLLRFLQNSYSMHIYTQELLVCWANCYAAQGWFETITKGHRARVTYG